MIGGLVMAVHLSQFNVQRGRNCCLYSKGAPVGCGKGTDIEFGLGGHCFWWWKSKSMAVLLMCEKDA